MARAIPTGWAPGAGPAGSIPSEADALKIVSPGQRFTVIVKLHNGSRDTLRVAGVDMDDAAEWLTQTYRSEATQLKPGDDYYANFRLQVPSGAAYTRPYFYRTSPQQTIYALSDPQFVTLPFPPPALHARASYVLAREKGGMTFRLWQKPVEVGGESKPEPGSTVRAAVRVPYTDSSHAEHRPLLAVAPDFSVALDPAAQVMRVNSGAALQARVSVLSEVSGPATGTLRLQAPAGWRVQPASQSVQFARRTQQEEFAFTLLPAELSEGRVEVRAVFEAAGGEYKEGFTPVTREDLDTFYYYQPAVQHISAVDVKLPPGLKVGYVMGAGDDIPTVLSQLGMQVSLISPEQLGHGDLGQYGTIVLGIRAYDTREDVRANNRRLLEYVGNGGTLVAQYNQQWNEFNAGNYLPYPAHESRDRVTVEEAPVSMLAPADPIFHFPNTITERDFKGWVQERGLYFMDSWDNHYQPLLSSADPGEPAHNGGLLRARYGKGVYIYAAYAFFRQLPEGVPGAIRLYVNLLSAGHEPAGLK